MNTIYINGIGVILPEIENPSELWHVFSESLIGNKCKIKKNPSFISKRKTRRMDRFSILALYTAYKAFEEFKGNDFNCYDFGTVYNSDYGTLNTVLEFAQCLTDDCSIEASPVTFANTVTNACVGHICNELGIKGSSTMLLGSNYVGYAMQLIRNDKVKSVLAGGIEEYNEELFDALAEKGVHASEGFSTLLLSKEKTNNSFCEILSYSETNLGGHYCFSEQFKPNASSIKSNISNTLNRANLNSSDIDVIITASNHKGFVDEELSVINDLFKNNEFILNPKSILGDLLGASVGISLTIGALLLKEQVIPKNLNLNKSKDGKIKYILVNDFNISSNYVSFILKNKG